LITFRLGRDNLYSTYNTTTKSSFTF